MSRTGFIYFSKPKYINWDFLNIKSGDLAIVYSNDISMQEFSDYYYVNIIQVNKENKSVIIQMPKNKVGAVSDKSIDLSIDSIKLEVNELDRYQLPFNYLADVKQAITN